MKTVQKETPDWKIAQSKVADYFKEHHFGVEEEVSLKSGKRIDVVALRKISNRYLNVLIEVKDWNNVTRRKESDFCTQIIQYIIEYAIEDAKKPSQKDRWNPAQKDSKDICNCSKLNFHLQRYASKGPGSGQRTGRAIRTGRKCSQGWKSDTNHSPACGCYHRASSVGGAV